METQLQSKPVTVEAKRKILLVEDEQDIRELVRYNLEAEGFNVVEASDGEIALKLAASERPALMILDLMLPGVPGLEVCRLLRSKEATLNLPVLMLMFLPCPTRASRRSSARAATAVRALLLPSR